MDAVVGHKRAVAENNLLIANPRLNPAAGERVKEVSFRQVESQFAGARHDGFAQGMLRANLDRRRESQQLHIVESVGRNDPGHARSTAGERAGFVQHDGVNTSRLLECFSTTNQHAQLGGLAGSDHDGRGRGQTKCAWTGDDQHGNRFADREAQPSRFRAENDPHKECEPRHANHGWDEITGNGIGQTLHGCFGALRFFD